MERERVGGGEREREWGGGGGAAVSCPHCASRSCNTLTFMLGGDVCRRTRRRGGAGEGEGGDGRKGVRERG